MCRACPHVFRESHRGAAHAGGDEPGLGLGLAIVCRLTDLLQHRLALRSLPGAQHLLHAASACGNSHPKAKRSAAVREAMRGQLQQWGLQVVLAHDEASVWAVFGDAAALPHAVLVDLRLANSVSGLELALRLRVRHALPSMASVPSMPSVPSLPFAILTGETDPTHVQAVRDAGLPLLTKPLRPARLRAQLEAMLAPLSAQGLFNVSCGKS